MKQSNDEPIKTANEQKAHNKYWNDLRKVSAKAADTLGVMHTLYVGVQYHATQVKVCAPNRKEALEMMIGIIERVLDDDKITYGKENGLSEMHADLIRDAKKRSIQ